MYDCINPCRFFSYIARLIQAPKFVIIKKQTEPDKPLKNISLKLNFLIKSPIATTAIKEVYVNIIVEWKPIIRSPINIDKITINEPNNKFLK